MTNTPDGNKPDRDTGDNNQILTDRIEDYLGLLMRVRDQIVSIEENINRVGRLLSHSQPNNAAGVISVRWWKVDRTGVRNPVLVHWEFTRNKKGKMKPVKYERPPRQIKETGVWSINAKETRELVSLFYSLKSEWEKNEGRFNNLIDKRRVRHLNVEKIAHINLDAEAQLDSLHERIRQNLQDNDYVGDF